MAKNLRHRFKSVVIRTPKCLQPNNTRLSDFTFGKLKITELKYAALTLTLPFTYKKKIVW